MSRYGSDDTPFWVQLLARLLALVLLTVIQACAAAVWWGTPPVGRVVAVASFDDDAMVTHYFCSDEVGYYPCSSGKKTQIKENRDYLGLPDYWQVVGSTGCILTSSERYLYQDTRTGRYFLSTDGKNPGEGDEIFPPRPGMVPVGAAEKMAQDFWLVFYEDGYYYVYRNGDLVETFTICPDCSFIDIALFTNSFKLIKYCSLDDQVVRCPTETGALMPRLTAKVAVAVQDAPVGFIITFWAVMFVADFAWLVWTFNPLIKSLAKRFNL